jgi:hypothetical protein
MTEILDSGSRRTFITGAVRDDREGKGRFDLVPLVNVGKWKIYEQNRISKVASENIPYEAYIYIQIGKFLYDGNQEHLYECLCTLAQEVFNSTDVALLNVTKHYENGLIKYGERNWEKGIPVHSYIDSACRHLCKYHMNYTDEPHELAFIWNILCCLWTLDNCDESLIDVPYKNNL